MKAANALRQIMVNQAGEYEHNHHRGFLQEKSAVEVAGGRVLFSSGDVIYSSSHIIENYAHDSPIPP